MLCVTLPLLPPPWQTSNNSKPGCNAGSLCYKHALVISRTTNKKKLRKQFTESMCHVFPRRWILTQQPAVRVLSHTLMRRRSKQQKTNNKATKASLAKPRRRCICSLSWDERRIHRFLLPEQIAEKQRSLRQAVSPACSTIDDTLSQVLRFQHTGHVPILRAVSTVHLSVHKGIVREGGKR